MRISDEVFRGFSHDVDPLLHAYTVYKVNTVAVPHFEGECL